MRSLACASNFSRNLLTFISIGDSSLILLANHARNCGNGLSVGTCGSKAVTKAAGALLRVALVVHVCGR